MDSVANSLREVHPIEVSPLQPVCLQLKSGSPNFLHMLGSKPVEFWKRADVGSNVKRYPKTWNIHGRWNIHGTVNLSLFSP